MSSIYIAFGFSAGLSLVLGKYMIPLLRQMKFGQSIRELGPQSHLAKTGTPTMGGFIFLAGLLSTIAVMLNFTVGTAIFAISTLGLGAVGFLDDYIKIKQKHNQGLTAKQKLLGQLLVGVLVTVLCGYFYGTSIKIPFVDFSIDLGLFYYPFMVTFILAISNGVNLTDGLDGLCGSVTFFNMIYYGIALYLFGQMDLALAAIALAGGLVGYIYYNKYPAKVFMGDLGSLALGGAVASLAMMSGLVLFVPIVGLIYVIETLSVMIQVGWYKRTKTRVFRMAPYHHHLELGGLKENQIVALFSTITIVMAVIAYIAMP